jgi:pimeloyl-ACP methyl ester carboxylesterase
MINSPLVSQLTENTSINLVAKIQKIAIASSLSATNIHTSYVHQGDGNTPILLLHGFDSSLLEFRRLLPLLSQKNPTFAVDLLGFGFTERLSDIDFSPESIKTHLYYFWKTVIKEPVILVGASMGGAAAIDLTLSHPEMVSKLVLIDSAGLKNNSPLSKFLPNSVGRLATKFLSSEKVRENVSKQAYFDQSFVTEDAKICAALHLDMSNWSEALISFTRSGGYGNFSKNMGKISQETLILWGEHDRILGTKDAHKFHKLLPKSQLKWINKCGHVPHLEKAQITADYILEFM